MPSKRLKLVEISSHLILGILKRPGLFGASTVDGFIPETASVHSTGISVHGESVLLFIEDESFEWVRDDQPVPRLSPIYSIAQDANDDPHDQPEASGTAQ